MVRRMFLSSLAWLPFVGKLFAADPQKARDVSPNVTTLRSAELPSELPKWKMLRIEAPEWLPKKPGGPFASAGFKVVDSDTGERLRGVQSVTWKAEVHSAVTMTVETVAVDPTSYLVGTANIIHICATCHQAIDINKHLPVVDEGRNPQVYERLV